MSGRRSPLTVQQAAQVGAVVAYMREEGHGWKEIATQLGMSAKQLRRYLRRHGMSQKNDRMSHRGDCAAAPRDAA